MTTIVFGHFCPIYLPTMSDNFYPILSNIKFGSFFGPPYLLKNRTSFMDVPTSKNPIVTHVFRANVINFAKSTYALCNFAGIRN